jgi:hypothetical protein
MPGRNGHKPSEMSSVLLHVSRSACSLPLTARACECNYRAAMTALNVGRLAGWGVDIAPEFPVASVWRNGPKRHTVRQGELSSRVQVFLKGAD